jgi:type II secretory pathway pseudopilin PulG
MNNKGATLLELVIVLLISSLLVLAMAFQFTALFFYQKNVLGQINASNDANMAMHSMIRIFRYAIPSTVTTTTHTGCVTSITATIAGPGYLSEITSNTTVTFGRRADNTFAYFITGGATNVIANNITSFPVSDASWDITNGELTLRLTATDAGSRKTSSLESKVHLLGE